jgi:dUTP pyrophosphatase
MDLRAAIENTQDISPGETVAIPTGLTIAVPAGHEAQIRPRSGLALRHGLSVLNTPGTIDSDYRGEVKVILANLGREPFQVKRGDRIAQLVICPVIHASWEEVEQLPETSRGTDGFGHTGLP